MKNIPLLNIGCGQTFHPDWVNVDMKSSSAHVIEHDLTRGLPFPDKSFQACYSSHVLEHLRSEDVGAFLREQKRVLNKGGILRIVVPDLEQICRNYLEFLDQLLAGKQGLEFKYDYTMLELFDQVVRDDPGGEMLRLWLSGKIADPAFVRIRNGQEADNILIGRVQNKIESTAGQYSSTRRVGRRISASWLRLRHGIAHAAVAALLGGAGTKALRTGFFRSSGEVHRVMYDRYSLPRLLRIHGFDDVQKVAASESQIPHFDRYSLDVIKGIIRKPDSIFFEATRGD